MSVLPQPGGPYSRMPLGAGQLVLGEQLLVEERQLDRVLDLRRSGRRGRRRRRRRRRAPPRARAPRPRAGAASRAGGAARASSRTESPARSFSPMRSSLSSTTRSSSARPTISARWPSSRSSLKVTTSPVRSGPRASTTLSDSLSTTSAPRRELGHGDVGVQRHPHLATAGEDVDGAVVVAAEEGAVGRRRLGELLDLLAQRGDVLARLAQGVGELLVLGDRLGELALGLEQALLEGAHPLGGVLEAAPKDDDLFLEDPDLLVEVLDLVGQACLVGFVVVRVDGNHLLVDLSATLPSPPGDPVPRRRAVTHRARGVTGTFGTCAPDAAARKLRAQRTGSGPPRGFSPGCPGFIRASHYSALCGPRSHRTPLPLPLTKR